MFEICHIVLLIKIRFAIKYFLVTWLFQSKGVVISCSRRCEFSSLWCCWRIIYWNRSRGFWNYFEYFQKMCFLCIIIHVNSDTSPSNSVIRLLSLLIYIWVYQFNDSIPNIFFEVDNFGIWSQQIINHTPPSIFSTRNRHKTKTRRNNVYIYIYEYIVVYASKPLQLHESKIIIFVTIVSGGSRDSCR